MQSKAKTVKEYIAQLPDDRKKVIIAMRKAIIKNIPKGFEETMQYGMIGYVVPHKLFPQGYHAKPTDALPFICLASQKNHLALYHMAIYEGGLNDWFVKEWKKVSAKKLTAGKSCIRFKKAEDVPLKLIGELATKITPQQWIKIYQKTREATTKIK